MLVKLSSFIDAYFRSAKTELHTEIQISAVVSDDKNNLQI